jgi:hypothetical protein
MSTLLGSILSVIRTDDLKFYFKNEPETGKNAALIKKRVSGVAELALALSKEALKAIDDRRFSAFDALIRNKGCQITAVEVCDIFQSAPPFNEVATIAGLVDGCARALKKLKTSPLPIDLRAILGDPEINPPVSLPLSKLLRFYVLRKARNIQMKEGKEKHITNERLIKVVSEVSRDTLETLVYKLQVEESEEAASFVIKQDDRIKRFYKEGIDGIAFTPLLENFEVCLNFFRGIALFSNKILKGGERLEGVDEINFTVSFPDGLVIQDLSKFPSETPVLFIEGTFLNNDPSELLCAAKEGRLTSYLLEQARLQEEARLLKQENVCSFDIDHFFCKSVREVVCEDSL